MWQTGPRLTQAKQLYLQPLLQVWHLLSPAVRLQKQRLPCTSFQRLDSFSFILQHFLYCSKLDLIRSSGLRKSLYFLNHIVKFIPLTSDRHFLNFLFVPIVSWLRLTVARRTQRKLLDLKDSFLLGLSTVNRVHCGLWYNKCWRGLAIYCPQRWDFNDNVYSFQAFNSWIIFYLFYNFCFVLSWFYSNHQI